MTSDFLQLTAIDRAGLSPARWQSDEGDVTGTLVRCSNRRLRAALMNIADNLTKCNSFFIGQSLAWQKSEVDPRAIRVRVAKHFTRLCFALVAGRQELRHAVRHRPPNNSRNRRANAKENC